MDNNNTGQSKFNKIVNTVWKQLFILLQQENLLNTTLLQDKNFLTKKIKTTVKKENLSLSQQTISRLITAIINRINGFGVLQSLLDDDNVSEIMVNGYNNIFIEKNGRLKKTNLSFQSEEDLLNVINRIISPLGRRVDKSSPMVDARLNDGSRINAIIPPLSLNGAVLTIRKFTKQPLTLQKLLKKKSLTEEMRDYLVKTVAHKKNILISGGTGTGKTSLLNAMAQYINEEERIITIEDSAELQLQHQHLISLESRPANIENSGEISIRDLVKNALRMRPDRIIVGEIRGAEAIDMLQAMNTGHQGSLTTIHANAPLEALLRLETMVLMGNVDLPLLAIRQQIISALDVIIQLTRTTSGKRKIIKIVEISKNYNAEMIEKYILKTLFTYH